jgi:hypothetical protein
MSGSFRYCFLISATFLSACETLESATPAYESMKAEMESYKTTSLKGFHKTGKIFNSSSVSLEELPVSVDLKSQLLPYEVNQSSVGACMTFASLAGIEAAYYREYGEKIKLSEQWLLRIRTMDMLVMNWPRKLSPSIYFGIDMNEILWWARRAGLCEEKSLPYNEFSWSRYERKEGKMDEAQLAADVGHFRDQAFLHEDQKLQKCIERSPDFKESLSPFRDYTLAYQSKETLMEYLAYGLPIYYVVRGQGTVGELQTSSAHAILLTGYNQELKRFYLRNSWGGTGKNSNWISFWRVDQSQNDEFSFWNPPMIVLGPKDITRVCADEEHAPADLFEYFCTNGN